MVTSWWQYTQLHPLRRMQGPQNRPILQNRIFRSPGPDCYVIGCHVWICFLLHFAKYEAFDIKLRKYFILVHTWEKTSLASRIYPFIANMAPIPFAAYKLRPSLRSTCLYIAKARSWCRFSWIQNKMHKFDSKMLFWAALQELSPCQLYISITNYREYGNIYLSLNSYRNTLTKWTQHRIIILTSIPCIVIIVALWAQFMPDKTRYLRKQQSELAIKRKVFLSFLYLKTLCNSFMICKMQEKIRTKQKIGHPLPCFMPNMWFFSDDLKKSKSKIKNSGIKSRFLPLSQFVNIGGYP